MGLKAMTPLRRILLGGAFVLFVVVVARVAITTVHDQDLRTRFTYEGISLYREGVPMTEMNPSLLFQYIRFGSDLAYRGYEPVVTLPFALHYYESTAVDAAPVYTLPRGTAIQVGLEPGSFLTLAYGLSGYPTYDRGWRYVQRFLREGERITDPARYYFVRTADLERVARRFVAINRQRFKNESLFDRWNFPHSITRIIDLDFQRTGTYLSPDLIDPVWDFLDLVLAVAGLALLSLFFATGFKESYPSDSQRMRIP